jgi:hypothetical protein
LSSSRQRAVIIFKEIPIITIPAFRLWLTFRNCVIILDDIVNNGTKRMPPQIDAPSFIRHNVVNTTLAGVALTLEGVASDCAQREHATATSHGYWISCMADVI